MKAAVVYSKEGAASLRILIVSKYPLLDQADMIKGLERYQALLPTTPEGQAHSRKIDDLKTMSLDTMKEQFEIISTQFLATLP